jgi:citrate synthase
VEFDRALMTIPPTDPTLPQHAIDPILENARVAAMCGAKPAQALAVALQSAGPLSTAELFHMLEDKRVALAQALDAPGPLSSMTPLEPELRYQPELATMLIPERDHDLRGRRVFGDLLGKKNFLQVAAWSIAGVELSTSDAELLSDAGVLTQLSDVRIWPLTVVRRVAAHGGGLAASVVAGLATLINPNMAVMPVAGFIEVLDRVAAAVAQGQTVDEVVSAMLANKERLPGVGRPVVREDERLAPKKALFARYGRDQGPSVKLAEAISAVMQKKKGLAVNSAGMQAALLRDLGFTPRQAAAFCVLYFIVPVLSHAVYAAERGVLSSHQGAPASADDVKAPR